MVEMESKHRENRMVDRSPASMIGRRVRTDFVKEGVIAAVCNVKPCPAFSQYADSTYYWLHTKDFKPHIVRDDEIQSLARAGK